jgi:uncharacterized protein
MELQRSSPHHGLQITHYTPGALSLQGITYTHPMIFTEERIIGPWEPCDATQINADHLTQLLQYNADLILIGTGPTLHRLPFDLYAVFYEKNQKFEIMSTPSACRTYNLMIGEQRNTVVAMLV